MASRATLSSIGPPDGWELQRDNVPRFRADFNGAVVPLTGVRPCITPLADWRVVPLNYVIEAAEKGFESCGREAVLDPIGRFRLFRARRRYMRVPATSRSGLFGTVIVLLVAAVILVTVLERRGQGRESQMVDYAASLNADPLVLVRDAARTRQIVVLGDVAGSAAPKHFAADLIRALADGPGVDFVALEVGSEIQPVIDRYLEGGEEDASALIARQRAVGGSEATANDFLAIYRRIWQINKDMGADRRIRIIAIDSPEWPPDRAAAPSRVLPVFAARDDHMMGVLKERVFDREETARVVVFVDGLRSLKGTVRLGIGGAASSAVVLLARQLDSLLPGRVLSVLVDAARGAAPDAFAGYRSGRLSRILRPAADGGLLAFPVRREFQATVSDLDFTRPPGLDLEIRNGQAPLSDVTDIYVRLSN